MAFAGYIQGNETSQREDLLDQLTILFPSEAPLLRTLPHRNIASVIHRWPIDAPFTVSDVRNPGAPHANARLEGADWSVDTPAYNKELRAIAEICSFSKKVSNTDRAATIAGVTSPFDYRAHQLFVKLINNIENVLMYGVGDNETSGVSSNRISQGLIQWCAMTGLERVHGDGSTTAVTDRLDNVIYPNYWSTFYNAKNANLSRQMLYNKILATAARAGAEIPGVLFHVGYKLKNLIADFGVTLAGSEVNSRNVDASSLMTYDSIDWIRTPLGIIGFRSNRYLDLENSTYTVQNDVLSGSTPTYEGSIASTTFQADETMIGFMPGYCAVGWYRPPHYVSVPSSGDYTWLAAVAEFALLVRHPVALMGGGNLLS